MPLGPKDGAVIVTTPQEVALSDVKKEVSFCLKTKTPIIGVVENMGLFCCPNCGHITEIWKTLTGGAIKMCERFGLDLLAKIPLEPKVSKCCEEGKSVVRHYPETDSAKEYLKLVEGKSQSQI